MRTPGLAILRLILQSPRAVPGREHDHSHVAAAAESAALRRWCARWPGAGFALLLLCLCVFLPGVWSIPPIDRDESRFAQASRQMYESGDYIVPRIQDRPRLNKPPLVYWLQCASVAAFGDAPGQHSNGNIWVFRLPGVLCAIASVLLTWRLGLRLMDPRAAAMGAAILAVCPLVAWDAHQARADQLLMLTVLAAQLSLWAGWRASRRTGFNGRLSIWPCAGLWLAVAAGIMTKGPVTPMIVLLSGLAMSWQSRNWRWVLALRPFLGLVIILAVVGPWVGAVVSRVEWSVYWNTVITETLGRSTSAKEGHWGPPGYHLIALCALFWPGVLMTGLAIRRAWNLRRVPSNLFLLSWIVPSWIVFELVTTKLPHYTMPLYPALALLSGRAVLAASSGRLVGLREWGSRMGFVIWGIVGAGILAAGIALLSLLARFDDVRDAVMVSSMWYLLIGYVLVQAFRSAWFGRWAQAQLRSIVAAVLMLALLFATLAPAANRMSPRIVEAIHAADPTSERPVAAIDYQEDSLIFLTRGLAQRVAASDRERWAAANPRGLLLLDLSADPASSEHADSPPGMISGLNYSRGRIEHVWLVWGEGE